MKTTICPVCEKHVEVWTRAPSFSTPSSTTTVSFIGYHEVQAELPCVGVGLNRQPNGKWSRPPRFPENVARPQDIDWTSSAGSYDAGELTESRIRNLIQQVGIAKPGDTVIVEAQFALSDEQHKRISIDLERAGRLGGTHFVVLDKGIRLARIETKIPEEKL